MFRKSKGQSILEYAMLMGVIVAVIVAIQIYVKRSVQGKLKATADQIGEQFTTGQDYHSQTIRQTARDEKSFSNSGSESTIRGDSTVKAKLGDYSKAPAYKGAEITVTDYVSGGTQGTGQLDTQHGTFESGKLSDKKLFDDD